jgi:hypothetical protein
LCFHILNVLGAIDYLGPQFQIHIGCFLFFIESRLTICMMFDLSVKVTNIKTYLAGIFPSVGKNTASPYDHGWPLKKCHFVIRPKLQYRYTSPDTS